MKLSKILAMALALAMVFSLAACGSQKSEAPSANNAPADTGAKSYTIGINTWGSGVPVLDMFGDAKEYTLTTMGNKVNRMSDDFSADKELQNVDKLVYVRGVKPRSRLVEYIHGTSGGAADKLRR